MTIRILTIPDETSQWPDWLEQQLIGLHLRDVIEELRSFPEAADPEGVASNLSDLFSVDELSRIVESGLGTCHILKLQRLFANPDLLLNLQEHILTTGSPYWDARSQTSDSAARASELRAKLKLSPSGDDLEKLRSNAPAPKESRSGQSRFLLAVCSLAAAILFAAFLWPRGPEPSGRILGIRGLTVADVETSEAYLERLADAGNTWFDQTPRDSAELGVLLRELSRDCEILINARHPILASKKLADQTTVQDWFVTKCKKWKADFDQTLTNLESGSIDFETARSQANATMMKLVAVLRAGPSV